MCWQYNVLIPRKCCFSMNFRRNEGTLTYFRRNQDDAKRQMDEERRREDEARMYMQVSAVKFFKLLGSLTLVFGISTS